MTRCTATAALMDADMQVIPGITLPCELEAGHDSGPFPRYAPDDDPRGVRRILMHPTEHRHTLTWGNPSVDELAEVLDPDESFDLEVDIADEATLEAQQNAGIDNGTVGPGEERDYPRIPDAAPRCLECGREVEPDEHSTNGMRHLVRPAVLHAARVA